MNMQSRIKQRPPELAPELKVADKARVVLADSAIALAWSVDCALGTGLRCRVLGEDGTTERTDFVIEAADQYRLVRVNSLDDFSMATPAIVGDRLLIRTQHRLYSIRHRQ